MTNTERLLKRSNTLKTILIILLLLNLIVIAGTVGYFGPKLLETMHTINDLNTTYAPTLEKARIFFDSVDQAQLSTLSESLASLSEFMTKLGSWIN